MDPFPIDFVLMWPILILKKGYSSESSIINNKE